MRSNKSDEENRKVKRGWEEVAGAPADLQTKKYSIHTRTVLLASQAPFVSITVDLSKQSFFLLFTRTGFSLSNVVRRILKTTEST